MFPGCRIEAGAAQSSHPLLAALRNIGYIFLRDKGMRRDVKHAGPHPSQVRPGEHACCPLLSASDVHQWDRHVNGFTKITPPQPGQAQPRPGAELPPGAKTYCHCKVEDCTCRFKAKHVIFSHSIYYLSKENLCAVFGRNPGCEVHTVHHTFGAEALALIRREASVELKGGRVKMIAKGNNYAYEHDDPSWVDPFGGLLVVGKSKFAVARRHDSAGFVILDIKEWGGNSEPPVPKSTLLSRLSLPFKKRQIAPGAMGFTTNPMVFNVSVLRRVSDYAGGKARTPELWRQCHTLAARAAREANLSDAEALVQVPACASHGFQMGAERESRWLSGLANMFRMEQWGSYVPSIFRPWLNNTGTRWLLAKQSWEDGQARYPWGMSIMVLGGTVASIAAYQTSANQPQAATIVKTVATALGRLSPGNVGGLVQKPGTTAAGALLASCLLAPLIEEPLKRFHWVFTALIVTIESWHGIVIRNIHPAGAMATAGMHVATAEMPLWQAIFAHSAYNGLVMGCSMAAFIDGNPEVAQQYAHAHPRACAPRGRGPPLLAPGMIAPGPRWWEVVLVRPIVEELAKRAHPYVTYCIVAYELAERQAALPRDDYYAPTAVMHCITPHLPLPAAVAVHSAWNALALLLRYWGPGDCLYTGTAEDLLTSVRHVGGGQIRCAVLNQCLGETPQPERVIRQSCSVTIGDVRPCGPHATLWNLGFGTTACIPSTLRSCQCNELRGLIGRVLAPTLWEDENGPTPAAAYISAAWAALQQRLEGDLSHLLHEPMFSNLPLVNNARQLRCLGTQAYVNRFPAGRREALLRGYEAMLRFGLTTRDLRYAAFVKIENGTVFTADAPQGRKTPTPRIIQGRTDCINVATGPWFGAWGKQLCAQLGPGQVDALPVAVAGGITAEELGEWFDRASQRCGGDLLVGTADAHRWDKSTCQACLDVRTNAFIKGGIRNPLLHIVRARATKTGYTKHGLRYVSTATVGSGDGDTSGGNGWDHASMEVRVSADLAARSGTTPEAGSYRSCVASDDKAFVTSRSYYWPTTAPHVAIMRTYGFDYDITVSSPPHAEFCSMLWWPSRDGTVPGPKPGRVAAKTFWCKKPLRRNKAMRWLRGVALGLRRSSSHVPVLRALVERTLQLTSEVRATVNYEYVEHRFRAARFHEATDETFDFACERYECTRQDLMAMEAQVMEAEHLPFLLHGHLWDVFVERDC